MHFQRKAVEGKTLAIRPSSLNVREDRCPGCYWQQALFWLMIRMVASFHVVEVELASDVLSKPLDPKLRSKTSSVPGRQCKQIETEEGAKPCICTLQHASF